MRGWGLALQQQVRQRLRRQARWQKRLLLVQVRPPASAGTSRPMARLASRDRLSRCSGISVNVAPTAYFGEILLSETAQTDCKINYC